MEIVLNARVVPEGLRAVVEGVVRRFTFGPQRFRWMTTPAEDVVLCFPPIIAESPTRPHDDAGRLLREGIEEEIRETIAGLLPFTEPAVEAQQ